jgi:hypothetical protein
MLSDEDQMKITKYGALPVVTGIYHALHGILVVNNFETETAGGYVVTMGLPNGLSVLTVERESGSEVYFLRTTSCYAGEPMTDSFLVARSNKLNYILSRINRPSPAKNRILNTIESCENFFIYTLGYMAHRFRRKIYAPTPKMDIPATTAQWLIDVYKGVAQPTSVPTFVQDQIAELEGKRTLIDNITKQYQQKCQDMFAKDKWVIACRMLQPHQTGKESTPDILIGAIDGHSLYNEVLNMEGYTHSVPVNFNIPITPFRGLDNIDPAIRDEIMGKLTMAKVYRQTNQNIRTMDSAGLFPNDSIQLEDIGFLAYTSNSTWTVIMMDK